MTLIGENSIGAEGLDLGAPPGDQPPLPPAGSAARSALLTSLGIRPLLIGMDLAATFVGVFGVECRSHYIHTNTMDIWIELVGKDKLAKGG